MPTATVRAVGFARMITSRPNTQPSATRSRASAATSVSNTARLRGQAAFDGGDDFVRADVEQAHARQAAAPQVMTLADGVARDGDVERRHRTVANRTRRAVQADDRRPDGCGNVRRAGI